MIKKYGTGYMNPKYCIKNEYTSFCFLKSDYVKASDAVKHAINSFAILECATVLQLAFLNAKLLLLGDKVFDELYGSDGLKLVICRYSIANKCNSMYHFFTRKTLINPDKIGKRNCKLGDWIYFHNDKNYILKHPALSGSGYNCFVVNDKYNVQKFISFGSRFHKPQDEKCILKYLVQEYNAPKHFLDLKRISMVPSLDYPKKIQQVPGYELNSFRRQNTALILQLINCFNIKDAIEPYKNKLDTYESESSLNLNKKMKNELLKLRKQTEILQKEKDLLIKEINNKKRNIHKSK